MDRQLADTQSARPEPCDWSNRQAAPLRTLTPHKRCLSPEKLSISSFVTGGSQGQAMDRRLADTQSARPEPCDWSNRQAAPLRTLTPHKRCLSPEKLSISSFVTGGSQGQAMDRRLADTQSARPEPCDWSHRQVSPLRTLTPRQQCLSPEKLSISSSTEARLNR